MKTSMKLLPLALTPILLAPAMLQAQMRLEEVLVTAEKRETTVQDTPIAVTAFSGAELDRALINKPLDMQFNVPNMLMSKGNFTTAQISLRGIGNLAVGSATDTGTGAHFNGVYLNNGRIFEIEYYDAERVEVLRGPQGTLYGRNTTAGVINFITQKPDDEFGGNINVELGDYNHRKIKGALNIPINDNFAQRFAVFYNERDGFVDNKFNGNDIDGRDMYSVRSSTRFQTDTFDATLTINYFEEDSDRMRGSNQRCLRDASGVLGCLPTGLADESSHSGAGATAFLLGTFVEPFTGLTFPEDDFINSPKNSNPREQFLDYDPVYKVEDTMVSLDLQWDFGDLTLNSLTGYHESSLDARNDYDFTVASEQWPITVTLDSGPDGIVVTDRAFNNDRSTTDPEQWSQEFRLTSSYDGDWNFMVGAFYLDYETETHYQIYSAAIEAVGNVLNIDPSARLFDNETNPYKLETFAFFGELYWQAADDIVVTLGARYSEEKKESEQRTIYLEFLDNPSLPGGGFNSFEGEWEEPTGKINVTWDATDDILAYATISRSYKSGGFNPISAESPVIDPAQGGNPDLAEFDPEYINSFEVGMKSRFFDDSLQANVTYFYYDYEGLQIAKITNQTALNENFDASIQGFEGEFIYIPDEHWRFSANLAWLDTEMEDGESVDPANINLLGTPENVISTPFNNQYIGPGCPNGAASCDGLPTDLEGNVLPNAPEFSVNIGIGYAWQLNNGMEVMAATNYYWQDEFYTRVFNSPNDKVDSWDVWNATVTLYSADRTWFAEVWGRNLMDDDHVTGQYLGDQNVGLATNQFLLEPRLWGISGGYNF